jgi:hypothetical protein
MCYVTDPLLEEGTAPFCGVCSDFGFNSYFMVDPLYKNMELWKVSTDVSADVKITSCLQVM